jgi:predicted TPR repeat methyltransferase
MNQAPRPRATAQAAARAAAPVGLTLAAALDAAVTLLREERLAEADLAFAELLRHWPDQPDAQHFQGVLRHVQGRSDEGIALIRGAAARLPGEPGPWNNLGNVLVERGRLDEATEAYRQAIAAGPRHGAAADAHNNLGTLHRRAGRWAEAEASCRAAIEVRPDFGDAWYNLSLALMGQGRIAEGLRANSRAIALWPRHLQARERVATALVLLGEREQAAQLYREWLAEEPDNPVVQHQLAACLGQAAPERASDAYVEQVFDGFARSFDAKLAALEYRAPELVADAIARHLGPPQGRLAVADAGCGTGLLGPRVRPWAAYLAGCDLSVGMLQQARPRGVYDVLHKAELVYYLRTQPAKFDVVLSADTLCYFGPLGEAMAAVAVALRPGGLAAYTLEALPDDAAEPLRLNPTGRYAHSRAHAVAACVAAGLQVAEQSPVALRMEAGHPVAGWLIVARQPGGQEAA